MTEENKKLEEILTKHEESIRKGVGEDVKRHIDVMLEKVQDDFKVFGEQLGAVSEDVSLLKEDMDCVKSDIIDMKRDIIEIKSELGEVNGKLDVKADVKIVENHETRIVKLENTVLAKAA